MAPISGDEYQRLVDAHHPSLYESAGFCFILFGPLSLVNHSCGSRVGFGGPRPLSKQEFPLLVRNSDDHIDIGGHWETKVLRMKDLDAAEHHHPGWRSGQQILVRYGEKPAKCACKVCSKLESETKRAKRN